MLAQERYNYILDALQKKRTLQISQLMHSLDVSGETIRRDLEYLEKEGLLQRVRGGASRIKMDTTQGRFQSRINDNTIEKQEIAQKALEYVSEGFSIALDYSTTSLHFARKIRENFEQLTIVTNSNEIVNLLSDMNNFRIIQCGGIFNYDEMACFGDFAHSLIQNLNLDIAFISCGGISVQEGLTETFIEGATMLRTFLNAAQRKIALVDHTKFDKVTFVKICDLCDVDLVITDSAVKKKVLEIYRSNGVDIETV